MALPGLESLGVLRITRIVQALQDRRDQTPRRLVFSSRLREVPALNGELLARFIGRVLIADLIALDSATPVYASGKLTYETSQFPKIKIGRSLTESQLEQLAGMLASAGTTDEQLKDFLGPVVQNALTGVEHRKEFLAVSMFRDKMEYDRFGYKATGITWGMPSDLKATAATPWTDASNATPIDNLLNLVLIGRVRYGIEFSRVTMSTQAFRYMIATTEFINKAKPFIRAELGWSTNFNAKLLGQQQAMFSTITGLQLEITDDRYWYQDPAGTLQSARFLPISEVVLDDPANDRDSAVADMAKGLIMESMLLGMNPAAVIGAGTMAGRTPQRGPMGYMTFPPNLDPPNLTLYAVDVAWPRKHLLQMNAILSTGAYADTIAVSESF